MSSIGYVLVLHNHDVWRQKDFECFDIYFVKPRTVPLVFVEEGSFDELCDPGCPSGF